MSAKFSQSLKNMEPPPSYIQIRQEEGVNAHSFSSPNIAYHPVASAPIENRDNGDDHGLGRPCNYTKVFLALIIGCTVTIVTIIVCGSIVWIFHSHNKRAALIVTTTTTTTTIKPICFDGNGLVTRADGYQINIRDLKIGDEILVAYTTSDQQIKLRTSPVLAIDIFQKHDINLPVNFIEIQTNSILSTRPLRLTPSHLLLVKKKNNDVPTYIFASEVEISDQIYLSDRWSKSTNETTVININSVLQYDAYAPLTYEGTLIVNNIIVSCYGTYEHTVAHWMMLPRRWLLYYSFQIASYLLGSDIEGKNMDLLQTYMKSIDLFRLSTRRRLLTFIEYLRGLVNVPFHNI